jgi:hypothetical protein
MFLAHRPTVNCVALHVIYLQAYCVKTYVCKLNYGHVQILILKFNVNITLGSNFRANLYN